MQHNVELEFEWKCLNSNMIVSLAGYAVQKNAACKGVLDWLYSIINVFICRRCQKNSIYCNWRKTTLKSMHTICISIAGVPESMCVVHFNLFPFYIGSISNATQSRWLLNSD